MLTDYNPSTWSPHREVTEYLAEIHRVCGENNADKDQLPDYIQFALHDVEHGLLEYPFRIAPILDQRLWDRVRLARRGECAKPRLDLRVTITSKKNLSILWQPRFDDEGVRVSDFSGWGRDIHLNEMTYPPHRPNNELLFIREIGHLAKGINYGTPAILQLRRMILCAARAVHQQIVRFLEKFCEVRMITDFHFELDENDEVTAWRVVDVADHWVETFVNEHGIDLAEFLASIAVHRTDGNGTVRTDKASRALRDRGFSKMTPKVVETLARAFEDYTQWPGFRMSHPELFRAKASVIPLNQEKE